MTVIFEEFKRELENSPKAFLRHYFLSIAGGSRDGESGAHEFSVNFDPIDRLIEGFTTGFSGKCSRKKERPKVRISLQNNEHHQIGHLQAHYVSMWTDRRSSLRDEEGAIYTFNKGDGDDLILTSQLSGCVFGIATCGARLRLTHIQPNRDEYRDAGERRRHAATTVQNLIAKDGFTAFALFKPSEDGVYGEVSGGQGASLIGVRQMNEWKFYAQITGGGGGPILNALEITQGMGL